MTEGFQTVLAASDEERRDLFVGTAFIVTSLWSLIPGYFIEKNRISGPFIDPD